MTRELTCIVCPLGCQLNVQLEDKRVISVSGNGCKRGKEYAQNECIAPRRVLTTTVKTTSGKLLSCKTQRPIPKECLFSAMKIINNLKIDLPISIGDVIIEDVFGSPLVATENLK